MSNDDILKYLLETNLTITTYQILISLAASVLIGIFIYFIYRVTYKGTAYSSAFGQSLVYTAVITTVIMVTIQSNLALSLGMVGSLSVIRFRTAIKETRDMVFVFWAVAAGVSCGAAVFVPGIAGSVILGILMVVFSFGVYEKRNYLLIISTKGTCDPKDVLQKYCRRLTPRVVSQGEGQELSYDILLRRKVSLEEFLTELKAVQGVENCRVIQYTGETLE